MSAIPSDPLSRVGPDGMEIEEPDEGSSSSEIREPFDPTKIRVSPSPMIIDTLLKRMRNGAIDLNPDFQRHSGLWPRRNQSRLIESILIRIPLPAFYIDARNEERWIVIDGLQRLTTLKKFVIDEDFLLSDLEFLVDNNGKRFSDLDPKFQRRIEETPITAYLVEQGTPEKAIFTIFRRINTGGVTLSAQEIRHALNQGPVIQLLQDLAESEEFRAATAGGVSGKRMADRECVLRFLAFIDAGVEKYLTQGQGDLDEYLNGVMAEMNRTPPEAYERWRQRFLRAMRAASAIFGDDAFRKRYRPEQSRYPVSKALFETWSVNLDALNDEQLKCLTERRNLVREGFMTLMSQAVEFERSITYGTGDKAKISTRFVMIKNLIREVLCDP